MTAAFRLFLLSLLAVLVSSGLIGCAVFSSTAQGVSAPQVSDAPVMMGMHDHHDGGDFEPASDPVQPHDHGDEGCDSCLQTLLNRASLTPDADLGTFQGPSPVFIIPVALQLDPGPGLYEHDVRPRGAGPPLEPRTLTHQKISLLI